GGTLTVYSGRNEELIQPLLDDFTEETGIGVDVRYGDSADLALLIEEEGGNTPADLFISQSPGAVGYLAEQGRLADIGEDVLGLVDEGDAAEDGTWVALFGRVRTLVYNTDLVDPATLPDSVVELPVGEGRLADIGEDVLGLVDEGDAAEDGTWVGLSGRVRTLVYNTDLVDPATLPDSVLDLTDEEYAGQVALAPTNGSFQDFVTVLRV